MFFLAALLLIIAIVCFIATILSYRYDHIYAILTFLFMIAATVVFGFAMDERSCTVTWNMSNTPSQYSVMTGCMIKIDDKWIPARNYREFED
jgi:hypothetical protein